MTLKNHLEKGMQSLSSVVFVLVCFVIASPLRAVVPAPDDGYPGFNTAEGQNALFNLTTGVGNTAVGWFSLWSDTDGSYNTAIGTAALLNNTTGSSGKPSQWRPDNPELLRSALASQRSWHFGDGAEIWSPRRPLPQRFRRESPLRFGLGSTVDSNARTIWIADAPRDNGKRFVVHADEKLTAFVELESAIRVRSELS
jgi:hypothetical protein